MNELDGDSSDLLSIWQKRDEISFDQWIKKVAELASVFTLERAARNVGTNPAEIEAVMRLSFLEDEDLKLLSENPPPLTTWFLLARMTSDEIKEAIEAIKNCPPGQPPSSVIRLKKEFDAPAQRLDAIRNLPGDIYKTLSARAKAFGVLNDTSRRALYSFGTRRAKGQELSDKQAIWADSMIKEMVSNGVLKVGADDPDATTFNELIELFSE